MDSSFHETGAERLKRPFYLISLVFFAIACALAIAVKGIVIGALLVVLPIALFVLIWIFVQPRAGLFIAFGFSFIAIGAQRYVDVLPLGLFVDGLLIITLIAMILVKARDIDWASSKNDVTALSALWMGYTVLELANPLAVSYEAWFYAMRGVAFYQLLMVPLGFLLIKERKDVSLFLKIWFLFSIFAAFKGIQQIEIGTDPWETAWLDAGGELNHRIQGRLRAFSIYSDAGQFGAAMGHAGLVAAIIGIGPGKFKKRAVYLVMAFILFAGMLYSGTRGAMFVPAAGFLLYLFLSKNYRVFGLGLFTALLVFSFLRFTTIGNTNYQVFRLRTAVRPSQDRSFLVRIENQRILKLYLANKPFGGGVGSAGNWGQRFSPNTILAQTPTDSWYVRIWAEMGIIGLALHLIILFWILVRCCMITWRLKDKELRQIMIGLASGVFGIMVASYGNGLYGQMPTGMIIYLSYVLMYVSPKLQSPEAISPAG